MLANKKIDAVIVVMLAAALIFTGIFMFAPDLLGITAAATEPEYLAKMFDKEKITEIEIEADAEDWQEMLALLCHAVHLINPVCQFVRLRISS